MVCRFALLSCPTKKVVVANTHLLYNPRRYDIRLCQTAMLLAEIDRLSLTPRDGYLPTILTGDFNSEAFSPVGNLLGEGQVSYQGRQVGKGGRRLGNKLLPENLGLSDSCQWQVCM